jgi:hypothetical protein
MKSKFLGAVVAPISIVGLTLALGLGTTAFGAGEEKQDYPDEFPINALDVSTSIEVAPWCGWYVSGGDSAPLYLMPDVNEPTMYTGDLIALTATAETNTAYVGPNSGLTEQGDPADCSWFTEDNKYGASYTVEASGYAFTAEALLPDLPEGELGPQGDTLDEAMDFTTDDMDSTANPLRLTNEGIGLCPAAFATVPDAEITSMTSMAPITLWSVLEANVSNNNFCEWSTKYEINIPAGMSPTYGDVVYRWTGPTLTHTLVIPEVVVP